jgi:hypothetical protein
VLPVRLAVPLVAATFALVSLLANASTADHPAGNNGARNRHPSAQAVRQSAP